MGLREPLSLLCTGQTIGMGGHSGSNLTDRDTLESTQRSATCWWGDAKPHLTEMADGTWSVKKEVCWRSGDLIASTWMLQRADTWKDWICFVWSQWVETVSMDGGDREAYSPPFSITINLLETSGKLELVPTAPAQSLAHVVQPTMSSC